MLNLFYAGDECRVDNLHMQGCGHPRHVNALQGVFNVRKERVQLGIGVEGGVKVVRLDIDRVQSSCRFIRKDGAHESLELDNQMTVTNCDCRLFVRVVRRAAEAKPSGLFDEVADNPFPVDSHTPLIVKLRGQHSEKRNTAHGSALCKRDAFTSTSVKDTGPSPPSER